MPYFGEVLKGEKGFMASVSDGTNAFIIHPMGEKANREFYSEGAARTLADSHAGHANSGATMDTSSWHRVA